MVSTAIEVIKREIDRKQAEINALQAALEAMGGAGGSTARKGTRRPRTAAEKLALSKAMKAAWRRRKGEGKVQEQGKKQGGKKSGTKQAARQAS